MVAHGGEKWFDFPIRRDHVPQDDAAGIHAAPGDDRAEPDEKYQRPLRRTRARRAGAHGLSVPAQARFRPGPRTLPAVRWRHEDHRRHRGAEGDRKDPHAPGLAGPRPPAFPGAAAGTFSGGLIPECKNGSAAALTIPHGLCLCGGGAACLEVRQFGFIQARIVIESVESLPETM